MIARILRWALAALLLLAVVAAGVYATRSDPIGPIAGRKLSGTVVSEPVTDWSFTDEHQTIAVETRPAAPHSVTVICFTHEGRLYVPAQGGMKKSWTYYALADPRVRVKVDDRVYLGHASRVRDESLAATMREAAARKYDFEPEPGSTVADVWLFRIDSRAEGDPRPELRGFKVGAEDG